jgi:hypothetical protein
LAAESRAGTPTGSPQDEELRVRRFYAGHLSGHAEVRNGKVLASDQAYRAVLRLGQRRINTAFAILAAGIGRGEKRDLGHTAQTKIPNRCGD